MNTNKPTYEELERKIKELESEKNDCFLSEIKYKSYIENAPDGILLTDLKGYFQEANKASAGMLNYSQNEMINMHISQILETGEWEKVQHEFQHIHTDKKYTGEYIFKRKDGSTFYGILSGVKMSENQFLVFLKDINDMKFALNELFKAKAEIEESESQFRLVFENSNDAICWAEISTGKLIRANRAAQRMFERTEKELIGKTHTILHPADKIEKYVAMFQAHILSSGQEALESEIITKSGKIKFAEVSSTIIKIRNKEINQGIFKDITERKKSEIALQESETRFRALFENANDGIIYLSENAEIVGINNAFAKMHGYTSEEMQNIKLQDLDVEDISLLIPERMSRLKNGEDLKFEVKHYHKNGRIIDFEVTSYKYSLNEVDFFVSFHRDITERKKMEYQIEESQQIYKSLFDQNMDGVYSFDMEGNFTSANERLAEMADCTVAELLEITFVPLVVPEDRERVYNHFLKASEGEPQNYITGVMTVKGHRFMVNITNFPIIVNNKIVGVYGIAKDVTARINAEESLRKSEHDLRQLNIEKDKFLSIIAHDLKNPFFALMGISELLMKNASKYSHEKIELFSKSIFDSAQNTYRLLENLLEWSRSQQGKIICNPTKIDLRNTFSNVLDLLRPSADIKNISIELKLLKPLFVFADEYMLNTVLRNLLSNAIKFSEKNGHIILNAEIQNAKVLISVKDNGIGMTESQVHDLFRLDLNTSQSGTDGETGTGLGLIICKDFIEKNEGQIFIDSKIGHGTLFSFTIPLCVKIETQLNKTDSIQSAAGTDFTILIAEDVKANYLYLEEIISEMNVAIIHAKNGLEAIELTMKNPQIKLILMDMKMPVLGGCDAIVEIKKINPSLPIIVQTAYAFPADKEKAMQCGCDDYITKPINPKLLINLINKHLNKWT